MSMLISCSRRRKLLVLRSFWRIKVSLCCTKGWVMWWTIEVMSLVNKVGLSKNRAIALDVEWRRASAQFLRQRTPCGPSPALQHTGQGQVDGSGA